MFRWDNISWIASGIFIVSIVLTALFGDQWLFLLVAAYLLRPTLIAVGAGKRIADERQLQIQYHSGNLALIVTMLAVIAVAIYERSLGHQTDMFNIILCIGLLAKALTGLVMNRDFRSAGIRITIFIGVLLLVFTGIENGPSLGMLIEGAPGILVLLTGLLGMRYPLASAIILAGIGIGTLAVFGVLGGLNPARISVTLLLSLPIFTAAFCFYRGRGADDQDAPLTTDPS